MVGPGGVTRYSNFNDLKLQTCVSARIERKGVFGAVTNWNSMGTGYRGQTMHEPILACTVGNPKHKTLLSCFDGLAHERRRKPDLVAVQTPHAVRTADLLSRQPRSGFEGWAVQAQRFRSGATRFVACATTTGAQARATEGRNMSLPRMSLHIGDYLKDTTHLDATLHGAYLLLIMHYWVKGSLPDDDVRLARIARMNRTQWRKARPILEAFFFDGWQHKRIEREIADAIAHYEKFARAGRASAQARAAKKNEDRSNDVGNDVGNERPQSFEQPRPDNQEKGEGDSAPARAHTQEPMLSPYAFELAAAYRKAVGVDPGDPQWAGLPYTAQVWVTRGYDGAAVLAFGSALAARYGPKPMSYHAKAIENEMNSAKKTGASNAQNRHGSHTRGGTNGTGGGFASEAIFHVRAASET
jgi:uncharacterized protein YdaU (DUF1376 family)